MGMPRLEFATTIGASIPGRFWVVKQGQQCSADFASNNRSKLNKKLLNNDSLDVVMLLPDLGRRDQRPCVERTVALRDGEEVQERAAIDEGDEERFLSRQVF